MPTIRISWLMRGLFWTTETPSWTRVLEMVFLNRKFRSSIFCSRLFTRTVPELSAKSTRKTRRPMMRPKYLVSSILDAIFFSAMRAPPVGGDPPRIQRQSRPGLGGEAALFDLSLDLQLDQPVLGQARPHALCVKPVHGLVGLLCVRPVALGL